MITKRFYITPNLGIPVIQRWQNNHWIFDRWPTSDEIQEEKVLYVYGSNSDIDLNDKVLEHTRFNADILSDYNLYNINKAKELDDRMKHVRVPLITDSQVYTVDTHNHSHKYLLTQMEIDSDATQGEKGTDHTWVGSDYEGGYCPRRCRCPCCGRSY